MGVVRQCVIRIDDKPAPSGGFAAPCPGTTIALSGRCDMTPSWSLSPPTGPDGHAPPQARRGISSAPPLMKPPNQDGPLVDEAAYMGMQAALSEAKAAGNERQRLNTHLALAFTSSESNYESRDRRVIPA